MTPAVPPDSEATATTVPWTTTARRTLLLVSVFAGLLLANACPESPLMPSEVSPMLVDDSVIVGAGDIANCETTGAAQTAALLDTIPGIVVTAGDNAYFQGSTHDYQQCYEPTWGRHKARTRPSPGNHEYETAGGAAYFDYFGARAGPRGLGYYSFSTGGWLILSLNSSVDATAASAQATWIRDTLASNPTRCTMAIFHHPPLASGQNGGSTVMMDIWRMLANADVDVVMTGHEHLYERFAKLNAQLVPSSRGIRLFIVGTGGAPLSPLMTRSSTSQYQATVWGVLKFTLQPDSYDWSFIPVPGAAAVQDEGHDACH